MALLGGSGVLTVHLGPDVFVTLSSGLEKSIAHCDRRDLIKTGPAVTLHVTTVYDRPSAIGILKLAGKCSDSRKATSAI
jgi:hypothetical protein